MLKIIFLLLGFSSLFGTESRILEADLFWDRGMVDQAIETYSAFIEEVEKIDKPTYQQRQDRFLALWKRSFIFAFLGEEEKSLVDLALIRSEDPHFVILEKYMVQLEQGEEIENLIEGLGESADLYFNQYYHCCDDCEKRYSFELVKGEVVNPDDVAACKERCKYVATLAYEAVGYLPVPLSWIGSGLVWSVNKGCERCCKKGGLVATCVTPFAKVLKYPVDRVREMIQEKFGEKSNTGL